MKKIAKTLRRGLERQPLMRSVAGYLHKDLFRFAVSMARLGRQLLLPSKIALRIRSRYYQLCADEQLRFGRLHAAIALWKKSNDDRKRINTGIFRLGENTRILAGNYVQAIGHLGLTAFHVKMKKLGWIDPQTDIYILAPRTRTANQCMMNYWRKYATVIEDPAICGLLEPLQEFCQEPVSILNLAGDESEFVNDIAAKIEREWHAQKRPPLLQLSEEHRARGFRTLEGLAGRPVEKFVVVHVRSRGFRGVDENDSVRNSDIGTYLRAFKRIAERGYWVVRLGDPTMSPLPQMENVIDYAHCGIRSDWMDVFLCGQAVFMIGTQSGPHMLADVFGVPKVGVNWAPSAIRPFTPGGIFIPKLLCDPKTRKILPFSAQVSEPQGYIDGTAELAMQGVAVIDNSEEEIDDVVLEMLDRIEGKWPADPQDALRQEQYNKICLAMGNYEGAALGHNFLRTYQSSLV